MEQTEQQPRDPRATRKLILIVVILLASALLFGVLAYRMAVGGDDADRDRQQALSSAECEHIEDEDLCKFFAGWTLTRQYTVEASSTRDDQTTEYVLENDAENDFRLTATGDTSYELKAIGSTIYTRTNDTWSEQTVDEADVDSYRMENQFTFSEPANEAEAALYAEDGTEACGDLTCLKYRVALSDGDTMHIWFDNEEYRLQRATVDSESYTYEAAFSYGDIEEVTAPSEPTVLPDDEYIPPGSTEPEPRPEPTNDSEQAGNGNGQVQGGSTTLPASGDQVDPEEYRKWREQRESN